MELLKTHEHIRPGNDCLLSDYVCLIRLRHDVYLVTHTSCVQGSWTGNMQSTSTKTFDSHKKALKYTNALINAII